MISACKVGDLVEVEALDHPPGVFPTGPGIVMDIIEYARSYSLYRVYWPSGSKWLDAYEIVRM